MASVRIQTTRGEMDEKLLFKKQYIDAGGAFCIEYYLAGELVHRSVEARLSGVQAQVTQAKLA